MTELPLLAVANFTQIKGGRHLFENLSFEVMAGQLVVIKGPNGSGKTTLLRCLAGIPDAYPGIIKSPDITTSYVGHLNALKPRLTVYQNLLQQTSATLDQVTTTLRTRDLLPLQDREVRTLSVGQRRQIALARLPLSGAKLWLVDEPTTHLDAAATAQFWSTLEAHLTAGGACVLTSHTSVPLPEATVVTLDE
ncbi:MAG: heme ABC exporter ATP-binding protein CcmA [Alphaproteobacteria bacterium]|jgi:heme exporter protein A|nr:heme ABC exporter ATP-binding protein CcmA [Alphaproteobacteria bacterium]